MKSNKKILIWIVVFVLAGVILLMVACEAGLFSLTNQQINTSESDRTDDKDITEPSATVRHELAQPGLPQEKEPETITVGKPYSGKLVEEGSQNVLIIGEDKVNNLYDTIGIASIDKKNKTLKIIMIPRDTYIEYNSDIMAELRKANKANVAGVFKINFAHHVGNIIDYEGKFKSGPSSFLAEVVKEKFGVEIDDYIKINTKGFSSIIDQLGGVDISVPYDMDYDDPTQDLSIHIKKGMRHLDGGDAEGFVRFRKGIREDGTIYDIGDQGRKKNQLDFLKALIKQKGTVKNIGKIPKMMNLLGKNIQHSVGLGDVLQTYIGMCMDIITNKYEIATDTLNTEKTKWINGASYLVFD